MDYIVITLFGFIGGAICAFVALDAKRKRLNEQQRHQDLQAEQLNSAERASAARAHELNQHSLQLEAKRKEFEAKAISYAELQQENTVFRQDLLNLALQARKFQLDHSQQQKEHDSLDLRTRELASKYLKDNVKWIGGSLTPNNFATCKQRLQDAIARCQSIDCPVPAGEEAALIAELKAEYERVVRAAFQREEQARIRAQIREEQLREQEIDRELKRLEREREAIKVALEKAIADAHDQHSEEVERLKARLADAEAKSQRAISQAQLTKSGHVYVISNIGSFGEGVFKVGMTRRLEPLDRVKELGDASVPFPFDVHMMVSCNDAPTLENALHRHLFKHKVNKTNPRKEFFKTNIDTILSIVRQNHGEVEYVADAEALQFRQSGNMAEDDQEFIEGVFDNVAPSPGESVDD